MKIAKNENLNWQTILIEEAETDIKVLVKDFILNKIPYLTFNKKLDKIILDTIKELDSETLKISVKESLKQFSIKLLQEAFITSGVPYIALLNAMYRLSIGETFKSVMQNYSVTLNALKKLPSEEYIELGTPAQTFDKTYGKLVEDVFNKISSSQSMYGGNVSLRNIAEMTVRYEKTLESIENLKRNGVNLVVSSKHANCSKRCEKWQGGHYTLDNTYQIVDGIQFQPLSNATDQYYTTRSGKVYKNGHITGYNCRHHLIPYKKGFEQPEISAETINKQRFIDNKMREMERKIRFWKDKALMFKGVNKDKFQQAKQRAITYNKIYINFAKRNNRPYYPSRTDVF